MNFEDLGLRAALARAAREHGYDIPTPVQARSIPAILNGRDVMAAAKAGSGKTAAYALPMLQRLMGVRRGSSGTVRALVIVPSRERASRVARSVRAYGVHLPFQCSALFTGFDMQPQLEALNQGVEIVVATPGRLLDHAATGSIDISEVEILVLDEVDRMLDLTCIHDVRGALALMSARRQNILFSDTFPDQFKVLAGQLLENPELIEVVRRSGAPARVEQNVGRVYPDRKLELR